MKPSPKKDSEECPDGKDRRPSVTRWGGPVQAPSAGEYMHRERKSGRRRADAVFDAFVMRTVKTLGGKREWDGVSRLAYMCPYHLTIPPPPHGYR